MRALVAILLIAVGNPTLANGGPEASTAQAFAALPEPEREARMKLSRALIDVTSQAAAISNMITMLVDALVPMIVTGNRGREAEIRTIISEEMSAAMTTTVPALLDETARVYAENFTATELSEMIAFYRTPTGKKAVSTMPALQTRMMEFGQKAGQLAGAVALPRIIDRLKAANMAVPTSS